MSRAAEIAIEVIPSGTPMFHIAGYGGLYDLWIYKAERGWRSVFPLPGLGYRVPERWVYGNSITPIPALIERAFPEVVAGLP